MKRRAVLGTHSACGLGANRHLCSLGLAEVGYHISKYVFIALHTYTLHRAQSTYTQVFVFVLCTYEFLIIRGQCFKWK